MLRCYFDDAWNDGVSVMGGFLSRAAEWARFSDAWEEVLFMPPRINCFVMNDAMTLDGEFRYVSDSTRDEKLRLLGDVIRRFSPMEVYSLLPIDLFRRRYEASGVGELAKSLKRKKYAKILYDPYYRVIFSVISGLARHQLSTGINEKIDFIFDEKRAHEPPIKRAWNDIAESQSDDMRKIISLSHFL